MSDIDTRLMKAAVALAEELSFSRAAVKLNIGQSALTKQIKELEKWLGYALFLRGPRGVSTTPEGDIFVEEARLALMHQERAVTLSRALNQRKEIVLHIGKSPYTDPYLLTNLLSLRLPLFPNLKVELSSKLAVDLTHDLLNGTLDLALLTGMPDTPRISSVVIARHFFYVAMLEHDELSPLRSVHIEHLAHRPLILFDRRIHPYLYDALIRSVKPSLGRRDEEIHHVTTAEEASHLVMRGLGVAILTQAGAWRIARDGITIRPLEADGLAFMTCLASRADNDSRLVSDFNRSFVRAMNGKPSAK